MTQTLPTLILIEDDPVQHMILKRMLSDSYAIQSFYTYQSALDYFSNNSNISVAIVCDIDLPDGDGLNLYQHVQTLPLHAECPFIFLTALNDASMQQRAANLGADDFLKKPISRHDLLTKLQLRLTRNRQLTQLVGDKIDHDLRQVLRPSLPKLISEYRLHLRHEEHSAGGGDFVFHTTHPQGMDYLIIGDTLGHGVPAKFFLHAYIGYLYGLIQATRHYKTPLQPHEILSELNHTLHDDDFFQRWQTTCMVVGIGRNGVLSFATAGHPVPWIIGKNAYRLTNKGMLPGFIKEATYHTHLIHLAPHEHLLIKTDGLILNPDIIEPIADKPAQEILDHIFTVARTDDDATAVLIERV